MVEKMEHQSVLLAESVEGLALKPDGIYIDGTFGRGGHSALILSQLSDKGRLIGLDKDPMAVSFAVKRFAEDARFKIIKSSFAAIQSIAKTEGIIGRVDGVLLDLGVSSPQLDEGERGFSFMQTGPLDMRMDTAGGMTAADVVNYESADTLSSIFRTYGEERYAGRISRAIVEARVVAPILTTDVLAEIVKAAHPRWEKHKHPATRVFQALRIYVNHELDELEACLSDVLGVMAVGGRLAVISFHSLEDRIVKQFMKKEAEGPVFPKGVPIRAMDVHVRFKRLGKGIKPSDREIKDNPRSRSAVLRVGEKIS